MAVPETTLRNQITSLFETEFTAEGFTVEDTKLLRQAGEDRDRCAIYPEETVPDDRLYNTLRVRVVLQVYPQYDSGPDQTHEQDPGTIEGYADRIRRMVQGTDGVGNTADFWFLKVTGISYPDDPTGKKSRLEARIEGRCENPSSV